MNLRELFSYPLFALVLILFILILPFFAILYYFVPKFAESIDELYADDPIEF